MSSSNEAGCIRTRPIVIRLVAEVELEPSAGELAVGGGDLTDTANAAALGIGVKRNDLGTSGREGEGDGLVAAPGAVDLTIGANLIEAYACLVLADGIIKGSGVFVLGGDRFGDSHYIATIVFLSTGVALVGVLLGGGTLRLATRAKVDVGAGRVSGVSADEVSGGTKGGEGECEKRGLHTGSINFFFRFLS